MSDSDASTDSSEKIKVEYDEFGFVKKRVCSCNGELSFSHVDDIGTEFFKCQKCGQILSLVKSKERQAFDLAMKDEKDLEKEISLEELNQILSLTIKFDYTTKLILFLTSLLTYTDKEQINLILLGESASGKTYNANEILWFFPKEDLIQLHGASPTSFIHESSAIKIDSRNMEPINYSLMPKKGDSKETWEQWYELMRNMVFYLDYSKKIIVLPDMPDTKLLTTIRSLLSHDKETCEYRVTESRTLKTKKVLIKGFFTTIFCVASTEIDEQEATRCFILSPEDSEDKFKEGVDLTARKHSEVDYTEWYETEPQRVFLKKRVQKIKLAEIREIFIPADLMENLKNWFIEKVKLQPRSMRDFPRLIALAKAWALFNVWNRKLNEFQANNHFKILFVNETDIETAKKLYQEILASNELGLSPEEYNVWLKVINSILNENGITISEAHNYYHAVYKRKCGDRRLRDMLKNFCRAGLCSEQKEGRFLKYYAIPEQPTEKKPEPQQKLSTEYLDKMKNEAKEKEIQIQLHEGDST